MTLGGWVSPRIACVLLGAAAIWFIVALVFCFRSRRKGDSTKETVQSKAVVGGFIGKASGVKIRDCHSKVKIIVSGRPEEVVVGGLTGQSENTEVTGCSADAEVEYRQAEG